MSARLFVGWVALLAGMAFTAAGEPPGGYRLVWADEFDTDGLPDPTRWVYETASNRNGWPNHELQYYAGGRPENSRVANGVLTIEARREPTSAFRDSGGQHYTSARLVSRGLNTWTYGFFEIRAKIPCGRGTWPDVGEIDSRLRRQRLV